MSIKSKTPGIASDMPLYSKQRAPIYKGKSKGLSPKREDKVDNLSKYVEENLGKVDKRGEYR